MTDDLATMIAGAFRSYVEGPGGVSRSLEQHIAAAFRGWALRGENVERVARAMYLPKHGKNGDWLQPYAVLWGEVKVRRGDRIYPNARAAEDDGCTFPLMPLWQWKCEADARDAIGALLGEAGRVEDT